MTEKWKCSYCGQENEEGRGRCEWCGNYADWTFNAITDRIGKAARRGDREAVLNESLVLKYRVQQVVHGWKRRLGETFKSGG